MKGERSMNILHFALVVGLLLIGSAAVTTQRIVDSGTALSPQMETNPSTCEENISILGAATQAVDKDGLLIVIARLGDGEQNRGLNNRRLHNVRAYLSEYVHARAPETIITAEGERVNGYGRIELYVRGKLFHVLTIPRNGDLLVGSCYYEIDIPADKERQKNLYPWLDRKPQHRQRRSRQRINLAQSNSASNVRFNARLCTSPSSEGRSAREQGCG